MDYDEGEEVVLITGGGSGLGECVAEIFEFRGVSVAVIDKALGQWNGGNTEGGVRGYECDVGDREEVERVWRRIVDDVSVLTFFFCHKLRETLASLVSWTLTFSCTVGSVGNTNHFDQQCSCGPWEGVLGSINGGD